MYKRILVPLNGSETVVVMTTQGLDGFRRRVLGSVAEQLDRAADAPVLLVRATAQEPLRAGVTEERTVGGVS